MSATLSGGNRRRFHLNQSSFRNSPAIPYSMWSIPWLQPRVHGGPLGGKSRKWIGALLSLGKEQRSATSCGWNEVAIRIVMSMIQTWISDAAASLGLRVQGLAPLETDDVLGKLRVRFADSTSGLPLWETIAEDTSRKRANGWLDIGKYVGDSQCLLITEQDGGAVYRVSNGKDLTRLLSECPGFEFYVTNEDHDYLLCHNHHDYLIGAGNSAEWVAGLSDD